MYLLLSLKLQLLIAYGESGVHGERARRLVEKEVQNKGLDWRQLKKRMEGLAALSPLRRNKIVPTTGAPTDAHVSNI